METEPQIIDAYIKTGKVRFVYRHLHQLGDQSELLSEVSECAADQGQFWAMRRALYSRNSELYADARAAAEAAAAELGLDLEALGTCLDAHTHREQVLADEAASTAEGIRSRPVFKIGDVTLVGAQPFTVFQQQLDAALAGS